VKEQATKFEAEQCVANANEEAEQFQENLANKSEQDEQQAVHFRNLLKATKHLKSTKKVRCFISYAWQPRKEDNAALQAQLVKLKGDLMKAGIKGNRRELRIREQIEVITSNSNAGYSQHGRRYRQVHARWHPRKR